jgi:hypothetical protein
VPNGDFYKMQREIRSNQVQKKSNMGICMQVDLESEKVESPNLLNVNDFQDYPIGKDKKLHLPEQDSASDISLPELKGVATTA